MSNSQIINQKLGLLEYQLENLAMELEHIKSLLKNQNYDKESIQRDATSGNPHGSTTTRITRTTKGISRRSTTESGLHLHNWRF